MIPPSLNMAPLKGVSFSGDYAVTKSIRYLVAASFIILCKKRMFSIYNNSNNVTIVKLLNTNISTKLISNLYKRKAQSVIYIWRVEHRIIEI